VLSRYALKIQRCFRAKLHHDIQDQEKRSLAEKLILLAKELEQKYEQEQFQNRLATHIQVRIFKF